MAPRAFRAPFVTCCQPVRATASVTERPRLPGNAAGSPGYFAPSCPDPSGNFAMPRQASWEISEEAFSLDTGEPAASQ